MTRRLVLASRNRGKLAEFGLLLRPLGYEVLGVTEFSDHEPPENGTTFVENALIKARHAAAVSGLPALADDSGLMVDALGGAPGVTSARYAGPDATDAANVAKLLSAMTKVPTAQRQATFVCLLAFLRTADDPLPLLCQGVWSGTIASTPRGDAGFGYDPIFLDGNSGLSAAELTPHAKAAASHRGKAARRMIVRLRRLGQQHDGDLGTEVGGDQRRESGEGPA